MLGRIESGCDSERGSCFDLDAETIWVDSDDSGSSLIEMIEKALA